MSPEERLEKGLPGFRICAESVTAAIGGEEGGAGAVELNARLASERLPDMTLPVDGGAGERPPCFR